MIAVLPEELVDKLTRLAKQQTRPERNPDSCAFDWGGGNFDNTYQCGLDDGAIILAQDIMDTLEDGPEWRTNGH